MKYIIACLICLAVIQGFKQQEENAPVETEQPTEQPEITPENQEEQMKQFQEQMKKMEDMMKSEDFVKLMAQMEEIKKMTCYKEVDKKLGDEIDKLNALGTSSFARKMVKKIRARLFGECVEKLDLPSMKDKNIEVFKDYDFDALLQNKDTNLDEKEKKWQEQFELTEKAIHKLRNGGQEGLQFGNININKSSSWKLLVLVILVIGVPIYFLWSKLFAEENKESKKKRLEKKNK